MTNPFIKWRSNTNLSILDQSTSPMPISSANIPNYDQSLTNLPIFGQSDKPMPSLRKSDKCGTDGNLEVEFLIFEREIFLEYLDTDKMRGKSS